MRNNATGFSRLGRVVAVIGISLGLIVVTTTPSQAFSPGIPTLPTSALPTTIITGGTISLAGAGGTAAGATVCAATFVCGAAVLAGILIVGTGATLLWKYEGIPNSDVVADGSVNWKTYPFLSPNTPEVIASYRFGDKPEALKEYPGTPNVQHCVVAEHKTIADKVELVNCNNAGTFTPGADSPGGDERHRLVFDEQTWNAVGFAVRLWVGGSITQKVWEVALIDCLTGYCPLDVPDELKPQPETIPEEANPDRRNKIVTRCTRPDGTHYYVTTYSTTYKQTDAQRPEIVLAACTEGPNDFPSGFDVDEEVNTPGTDDWGPSVVDPNAPETDGVIEGALPPTVTDPNYDFRPCLTGQVNCDLKVEKVGPDGTYQPCSVADCSDIDPWVNPQAPTVNNPYRCTYNGVVVAQSECAPLVPDIKASLEPLTPTTSCGLTDIACWLDKIFIPRKEVVDTVTGEIKQVWDGSVIGRLPFIIGGFSAPFFIPQLFEPNEGNCNGPTITLPRNMGVESVGITGDYVIQPLKACDGLAKTISETWRDIAEPTVYVTGGIAVVNTLLGAVGLSLRGIRNGGK